MHTDPSKCSRSSTRSQFCEHLELVVELENYSVLLLLSECVLFRTLVSLLSGVDPSLSFSSHSHRRLSSLLHKLFVIQPIIGVDSEPLIRNFKSKSFM